jgi:hypothetical protein
LFLRKRKKIRKTNQSKRVLRVIGGPGSPEEGALLSSRGGQEDKTICNCCIKKRKKERE